MRLKAHDEVLSAAGPPHTELAGRCLGKVMSIIWDRKDTGSLKRCNGQCVFRWYLRESLGWLDFSSSILGDGYKYSTDKDGILDVDNKAIPRNGDCFGWDVFRHVCADGSEKQRQDSEDPGSSPGSVPSPPCAPEPDSFLSLQFPY